MERKSGLLRVTRGTPPRVFAAFLGCLLAAALGVCAAGGPAAGAAPQATPGPGTGGWRWEHEPGKAVARLGPKGVLWRFHFDPALHLPYFDLATTDGRLLTWNRPPDHPWHHALWWAWKFLGGVNYWEIDPRTGKGPGRTGWKPPRITTRPDGSARIEMDLEYRPADHPPGAPAVLTERRVVEVSPPAPDGTYHLDWTSTFTAGPKPVVFDRTPIPGQPGGKPWGGYAGLSVRLAKDLRERRAVSSDGPVRLQGDKYRGRHTAMDYAGTLGPGPVGIAILDHPKNLRAPTPWYVIVSRTMSYFSPAVLCYGPYTLGAGESMTLRYRVLVHTGRWDAERLRQEYARFAQETGPHPAAPASPASGARVRPEAPASAAAQKNQAAAGNRKPAAEAQTTGPTNAGRAGAGQATKTTARGADEIYPVTAPPAELNLPPFYKKYVDAHGLPIVSSEKVNDYALKEAAFLVDTMLSKRPDIRKALIESGSRIVVLAYNEFTTDIPEYAHLKPKAYWDVRARGLGGSETDPICSCAEENLLGYPGDPYATECILIHEFAHLIHLRGLLRVDPTFDRRLKEAYHRALSRGLWVGTYASVNSREYWAEGVQSYFNNNREPDHDHNHVNTREELEAYDPGLAALCREVFGDTPLVYTKPATRLTGHLAGYDPSKAPRFKFPPGAEKIRDEIRRKARARATASNHPPRIEHEVRQVEGWTVHVDKRLLSGEHEGLGKAVLRLLAEKLYQITRIVPADRLAHLRQVPIWLDLDHALRSMQYHPAASWLREHGYDPAMAKAVHIPNARGFLRTIRPPEQPFALLHELAHAYHDRVLGFKYPPIVQAYRRAVASHLYDSVLRRGGRKGRHYALTNPMEFFAEMTEAYLGTNDFWPFVRWELLEADPETYHLLERIWEKGPAPPLKPAAR